MVGEPMANKFYVLPEYSTILSVVDSLLHHLNVGLLIYHLEDPDKDRSLRLIYANNEASRYTGSDLQELLGKYILDAFPGLKETTVATTYADVVRNQTAADLGEISYRDDQIEQGRFGVKAFPMPSYCVGVLFERKGP